MLLLYLEAMHASGPPWTFKLSLHALHFTRRTKQVLFHDNLGKPGQNYFLFVLCLYIFNASVCFLSIS